MDRKEQAAKITERLKEEYPGALCSLEYQEPYQLLIATRLSAQCTDARVNIVTEVLFSRFPTLESLAEAEVSEIEEIIKSCGFYKMKARDVKGMCEMLVYKYHGRVPDSIEELVKLPGVGRKTANLVVGDVYHQPAVVCDTHCIRITNLMGLTDSKDPLKVEKQLRELLEPAESNDFCHRMVLHGRAVCKARRPYCAICAVQELCDYGCEKGEKAQEK